MRLAPIHFASREKPYRVYGIDCPLLIETGESLWGLAADVAASTAPRHMDWPRCSRNAVVRSAQIFPRRFALLAPHR
jgi:hypothetical protein